MFLTNTHEEINTAVYFTTQRELLQHSTQQQQQQPWTALHKQTYLSSLSLSSTSALIHPAYFRSCRKTKRAVRLRFIASSAPFMWAALASLTSASSHRGFDL